MTRLFEERERAAETIFAHAEELQFLARRRSIQALAAWASDLMRSDSATSLAYERDLVAAMVKGADDGALATRVRADLKSRGHQISESTPRDILARATAQAIKNLAGA